MCDDGKTTLVILAPLVDTLIQPIRAKHTPSGKLGMPPHVTLIFPFKPISEISREIEERLSTMFASCKSFGFSLRSLGRFPNVLYLKPSPAEPFVQLTKIIVSEFPENLPHEGKYSETIPHLTVANEEDPILLGTMEDDLRNPIEEISTLTINVESVCLLEKPRGAIWKKRISFKLGDG